MANPAKLDMSASALSHAPTSEKDLDKALAELHEHATEFARLSASAKSDLLLACIPRLLDVSAQWVASGTKAKGLGSEESGEEWLAGPTPTIRMARLIAESLREISQTGKPSLGTKTSTGSDGRLRIDVFPNSKIDSALFAGFEGYVIMQEGVDRDSATKGQASFYSEKEPEGGVSIVLGAGNVSSIPPMDTFTKMFTEGKVVMLKMNPVNEWVGPCLETALAPLIDRGFLRIVYGGGSVGKYLVEKETIADVHITGSDKTHDLIVWGPEGEERERRIRDQDPRLKVPICSELGNVTPVAIVPYEYSDDELAFQARNVATMICNNASFNCNAAKMLVTGEGWSQRDQFFSLLRGELRKVPTRKAYYPGAFDRYESLVSGRKNVEQIGHADDEHLPWTIIHDLDASDKDEPLFRVEPFCSILSETQLGSADPVQFLQACVPFMNDTLWGTLAATIIIPPALENDKRVKAELDRTILDLRYGGIGINHWAGLIYGLTTLPWGGHASASPEDIQSGLGWVHNTYMLEGIDKSVIRGDLKIWPTPPWFAGNTATTTLGPKLTRMEASPGWTKVPGIALRALFGK